MIRVNDDYVIDVDDWNYSAMFDCHKIDKKGEPVYKMVGHFNNLQGALNGIIKDRIAKNLQEDVNLAEAIEIIREIHEEYDKLFEKVLMND